MTNFGLDKRLKFYHLTDNIQDIVVEIQITSILTFSLDRIELIVMLFLLRNQKANCIGMNQNSGE
jgi:hypothetical protein